MGKNLPFVSVIIPNYNHGAFLSQRIESVLNQSFQDFELLLLDDCSTDNSREIIESYRANDKVSQIVFNDMNGGNPFKQWDKGISLSKGMYVWIAESDDWCESTLLERLLAPFLVDENCTISYCQSYCMVEDKIQWQSFHPFLEEVKDGMAFIREDMLSKNAIFNASMALWKRDLYSHIPHDYQGFEFVGDKLFWIRLAQKGTVSINGRLLNYFRKHKGDVTSKATKGGIGFLEDMKILNKMFDENMINADEYYRAYKRLYKAYWLVRKHIDVKIKQQIDSLYENPRCGKKGYFKALFSAIWNYLKILN